MMFRKSINKNAKEALNQMKLEIASELTKESNILNDENKIDSIGLSARVGGQMSKELVKKGEQELMKKYNKKYNKK